MAFEGHICCWHIYGNSMVNESFSILFVLLINAAMCSPYIDFSSSAVGITYMHCGRHICSGAYASNVKCMYTGAVVILLIAVGSYEAYTLT